MPTGFVPTQDKQYLVAFAQLPEGSSLDRTEAVIRRMSDIGLKQPGVDAAVAFPGLSISGFSVAANAGIVFFTLKPFEERRSASLSGPAIAAALNQKLGAIKEAFVLAVPPPAVMGLGTIGGFKLYVEDRADLGYDALFKNLQGIIGQSYQTPSLGGVFSMFTVNVPQLDAEIDRVKAKTQGVPLQNLFETLQIYLGSLYVNDFNRFGRTFEVVAQADAPFRATAEDITRLKTRNDKGEMVPLGAIVKVTEAHGPDRVMRYNGYPAAEINGAAGAGVQFRSGGSSHDQTAGRQPAARHVVRMDGTHLPAHSGGQHGHLRRTVVHPAGVSGAGRLVRELPPAAGHHFDRADVPVVCHHRRLAQGQRQQHLYADRIDRAGGPGLQERHPDRGICQAQTGRGVLAL